MKIKRNYLLKKLNTYQINTKTKYFFEVKSENDLINIFTWIKEKKAKKFFILAGGSNIIFKDNFYDGLIIKISNNSTRWLSKYEVQVGAGRELDSFLNSCQKRGLYDIQSLAGIPGSVGGGVFGNVGAFGQEIRKFVSQIKVYNLKTKKIETLQNKNLNFSYRNSFLKQNRNKYIIFSVYFDLSKKFYESHSSDSEYFSLKHFAQKHDLKKLQKKDIRKNILKIRKSIYPNIKKYPNVGSTFKNTEVTKREFQKIKKLYPNIPNWKLENGKIKIPTAYIFDKILRLNGKTFGHIKIDNKRPLFLINIGKATGQEFYNLCQKIKKQVKDRLGIQISEEVCFVK